MERDGGSEVWWGGGRSCGGFLVLDGLRVVMVRLEFEGGSFGRSKDWKERREGMGERAK